MKIQKHHESCQFQGDPAFYTDDRKCTCLPEPSGRIGYEIYTVNFQARCPNDGELIYYTWKLKTGQMHMVEDLKAAVALIKEGIQEQIIDGLHEQFGGEQRIWGTHQGVRIKSVRLME